MAVTKDKEDNLAGSSIVGDESDSGTVTEKEKADEVKNHNDRDNGDDDGDDEPSVRVAADEFGRDIEAQGVSTSPPRFLERPPY